ncbi:MAG: DUF1702 family protein [Flavobacteriales bacterium]|nr:DUF1702 family protein [Flavobacteriales bacterium]
MEKIAENIETVVSTFQKGRALGESRISLDELIMELDKVEQRYRSVAYEGASMGVSIVRDDGWRAFRAKSEAHSTQIHIGLGWAFAEQEWPIDKELHHVESEYRSKVLDGFGYWHGLFRIRLTIRTQTIPEVISTENLSNFDQGVGRAIWYISKGEVEKLLNIIGHFPEERKPNLWRGIGIASTYVDGCSEELISELKIASKEFNSEFEKGIKAAENSLLKATF